MLGKLSTEYLATASARRPKRTIALWLVLLIIAAGLAAWLFQDAVTTEFKILNNAESRQANTLLEERLREPASIKEVVIVRSANFTVDDPTYRRYMAALYGQIVGLGGHIVETATSYYQTANEALVSKDRHSTILPLVLAGGFKQAEANINKVHEVVDKFQAPGDFEVYITGKATFAQDYVEGNKKDLAKGEAFGVPIAMIILAVVFGALAAVVLPMALALGSIVIAIGLAALIGQGFELSSFVQNMITMIGLAVGIDYSLFIVSRYREERARGLAKLEAIAATGATASRAVLFSGITVIIGLLGLLVIPHNVPVSVGMGAILVVSVAVTASLTLLPALLSLMGDGVNRLRIPLLRRWHGGSPVEPGGFWDRLSFVVIRRPIISLIVSAGLLIAATIPYFSINTGTSGVSTFPDSFRAKEGFVVLQREFGFGLDAPAQVVIDGDVESTEVQIALKRLQVVLGSDGAFGPATLQVNATANLALLSVPLVGDATSEATIGAVYRLRGEYVPEVFAGVPARVLVTGTTAEEMDFINLMRRYQPIVLALVLGLSFLLLTVVFRSIVVPLKAIVMNLLSVGAAYGILVLVWQKGVGNAFFGFPQVDVIEAWMPIMLFAVLFGLSMDYHVFLLSRVRERYDQTGNNAESVAYGLRSTAGLITGAAMIMVAIFSGFAAADVVQTAQFGFGMAVAILLDATVVRSVLVPATMKLLGDRNWYLPNFLRWLPQIRPERASHGAGPLPESNVSAGSV